MYRGGNSGGTGEPVLFVNTNYRAIAVTSTVVEKSPFEGGRGMTNANYKTLVANYGNNRNSPLGRGRG
jgi:hypothetical protein